LGLVTRMIRLIRAQIRPDSRGWSSVDRASQRHRRRGQTRADTPSDGGRQGATTAQSVDPELAELYANMEVPYGSNLATVRKAWIRLLRKYHPDLHSKDLEKRKLADELTQRLNGAYERLRKRSESETHRQEK
jgi:DnaJ-domain-containing protein 1